MYKASFYNIFLFIPETNEFLLYNTYHGGIIVLESVESKVFNEIISKDSFSLEDYTIHIDFINSLIEKGYIVNSNVDEIKQYEQKYHDRVKRLFYSNNGTFVLTIATTNSCNMKCPYCFEFDKHNAVINDKLIEDLETFLESVVQNSQNITNWAGMDITWYGGEPLVAQNVINKLSPKLIRFAEQHQMKYSAGIITNGILLTKETWSLLQKNQVKWAQITIDGNKETHNIYRPLKNIKEKNYERILENIAKMPQGMSATIRVNTDKKVVANFEKFLDDLNAYGIWPQRHKEIKIVNAWLRTYEQASESKTENRIPLPEWMHYRNILREIKLNYYNRWADQHNMKRGRLAFNVEKASFEDCWAVISPFSFVIDADGYTYKCWEVVHDKNFAIQHISEKYDREKYNKHLSYNRFDSCTESSNCKYLPICGTIGCAQAEYPNCSKYTKDIETSLKEQYLQYKQNPDKIVFS